MYPYINIFGIEISSFILCGVLGISVFFLLMYFEAKKTNEVGYIFPKLFVSMLFGFFGALLYDGLFKISENGYLKLEGISFYGGLIGCAASLYFLCKKDKSSGLFPLEWLDKSIIPFSAFHCIGRIGCFLGGCCYGIETTSFLGVCFPDNVEKGIIHNGECCLPTQLFEAGFIVLIIILLKFVFTKNRFINYLIIYPIFRFFLEFLRGDDRGNTFAFLSPSQLVSALLLIIPLVFYIKNTIKKRI